MKGVMVKVERKEEPVKETWPDSHFHCSHLQGDVPLTRV